MNAPRVVMAPLGIVVPKDQAPAGRFLVDSAGAVVDQAPAFTGRGAACACGDESRPGLDHSPVACVTRFPAVHAGGRGTALRRPCAGCTPAASRRPAPWVLAVRRGLRAGFPHLAVGVCLGIVWGVYDVVTGRA